MSMTITDLKELGFIHTHTIGLDLASEEKVPVFRRQKGVKPSKEPSVYLWVAEHGGQQNAQVLYVGKAGKGVDQRSNQHQAGFQGSSTGRKNAEALVGILSNPMASVKVLARKADTAQLFGTSVSLYSSEEEALCAVLRPRLNRQVFPKIAAEKPEEANNSTQVISNLQKESISTMLNDRLMEHELGTVDDVIAQMEEVYSPEDRYLLRNMLTFVENELLGPGHRSKLIRGYADQLHGCNGVTTLTFGETGKSGRMKGNGWVARIYLGQKPMIGFPVAELNPIAHAKVEMNEKIFSPIDIHDMFRSPHEYLRARGG